MTITNTWVPDLSSATASCRVAHDRQTLMAALLVDSRLVEIGYGLRKYGNIPGGASSRDGLKAGMNKGLPAPGDNVERGRVS